MRAGESPSTPARLSSTVATNRFVGKKPASPESSPFPNHRRGRGTILSTGVSAQIQTQTQTSSYYGPSSSVSSLGFESGYTPEQHDSSSSDENYDSDRSGSTSRRPSIADQPRATIRQLYSSSRAMKPKVKSFLRISKELRDEQSPMDCEIRREAEITQALRDDNEPEDQEDEEDEEDEEDWAAAGTKTPDIKEPTRRSMSSSLSLYALTERVGGATDTDDSDSFSFSKPALKRKAELMEESSVTKRRAVSPGLSPKMGSPSMGAKRSQMKRVQDASEGFENMSL